MKLPEITDEMINEFAKELKDKDKNNKDFVNIKESDLNKEIIEKVLKQDFIDAMITPEVIDFEISKKNKRIYINSYLSAWKYSITFEDFETFYDKAKEEKII